jgi:hypothetical protein
MWGMAQGLDCSLVGYLVAGFFVTVLYYPFFWINLAMTVALHNAARNAVAAAGGVGGGGRVPAPVPAAVGRTGRRLQVR